ncbi:MAG TPA: efflux RND transporter periplasmic adaptor subunit, partial [Myxococcaceae bacterium]|nr:efflux RND transporter periplasmic adaptor subunit [Myxococcaceae bacterium]
MGQKMVSCGSPAEWEIAAASTAEAHAHGDGDDIAYYTCSMHPSVKQPGPGTCPICAMDLTPVTHEAIQSGVVFVDEAKRQLIGVRTARVERKPIMVSFRALGRVTYDETKLTDVTLRVKGWVQDLRVNETGQPVRKGQVLFSLYSPELYAAQQEYLLALRRQSAGGSGDADPLLKASRQRLYLWGLSKGQIDAIASRGEPTDRIPFLAPTSGFVIEKNVVEGAAVEPGQKLYRIAALDTVWVDADVYETDLPRVKKGQSVEVTLPFLPGKKFQGRVSYVYPVLTGDTRTGKVRIELPNEGLELKPDMYAEVSFQMPLGERLQIPASAVIYTGPRRLVFLDLGEGKLKPQEVEVGIETEDAYEIVEGLKEGDVVVTSGNFLVAAESRIRSAADYWSGGDQ